MPKSRARSKMSSPRPLLLAAAVLAILAIWLAGHELYAPPLLSCLAGINLATFFTYAYDKSASRAARTRMPESFLHLLAAAAGTPAALLAQQIFRHKTTKQPFQLRFRLIAIAQVIAIGGGL